MRKTHAPQVDEGDERVDAWQVASMGPDVEQENQVPPMRNGPHNVADVESREGQAMRTAIRILSALLLIVVMRGLS